MTHRTTHTDKLRYAKAVLAGSMTKVEAFRKYINQGHSSPSQGVWRLEQTDTMQTILCETEAQLKHDNQLHEKARALRLLAMDEVSDLLSRKSVSTKNRLALLRLTTKLTDTTITSNVDEEDNDSDIMHPVGAPLTTPSYSTEGIIQ